MKTKFFSFIAVLAVIALMACGNGNNEGNVPSTKPLTFEQLLSAADSITKPYGDSAKLYEASTILGIDSDGVFVNSVDPVKSQVVYRYDVVTDKKIGCLIVTFDAYGNPNLAEVHEPWLEDEVIDGGVMPLDSALKLLYKADIVKPSVGNVVLRHALIPSVKEPEYIFGNSKCNVIVGAKSGYVK